MSGRKRRRGNSGSLPVANQETTARRGEHKHFIHMFSYYGIESLMKPLSIAIFSSEPSQTDSQSSQEDAPLSTWTPASHRRPVPSARVNNDSVPSLQASTRDVTSPSSQGVDPPRRHSYGTRLQNQSRRPGKDVGLEWQTVRREREAADVARAERQVRETLKRAEKLTASQHVEEGIRRLAFLDLEREEEEREEDAYVEGPRNNSRRES